MRTLQKLNLSDDSLEQPDLRFEEQAAQFAQRILNEWSATYPELAKHRRNEMGRYVQVIVGGLMHVPEVKQLRYSFTHDHSVFFQATLPSINTYLELYFEDGEPMELVCLGFKNKQPLPCYSGPVVETLERFVEEVKSSL